MAKAKTYTQDQLDAAKKALSELPDLRKNKITTSQMIDELKTQINSLAEGKGYSPAEIKSALEGVGITVPASTISSVLRSTKKRPKVARMTQS